MAGATETKADELTLEFIQSTQLLKQMQPPAALASALETELLPLLDLPSASSAVVAAFSHPDVTAEKVAAAVSKNQALEEQFLRCVQGVSKRPDRPSVEAGIVLLGMQNSRNLLVCLQLQRQIHGKFAAFDSGGKVAIDPKNLLKLTQKTEDLVGPKDTSGIGETLFSVGLLFDSLSQIAVARGTDKTMGPMIEQNHAHGVRTAQVARALSEVVGDFPLKKLAFGTAIVHDLGKAVMSLHSPDYLAFTEACAKQELPRDIRVYAEQKRFGQSHAEVGARVLSRWPILSPAAMAVLFHHRAPLLKGISKQDHQLASVIHLATKIATKFKKPDGPEDPILAQWLEPELKGFLPSAKIIAALQKVNF